MLSSSVTGLYCGLVGSIVIDVLVIPLLWVLGVRLYYKRFPPPGVPLRQGLFVLLLFLGRTALIAGGVLLLLRNVSGASPDVADASGSAATNVWLLWVAFTSSFLFSFLLGVVFVIARKMTIASLVEKFGPDHYGFVDILV